MLIGRPEYDEYPFKIPRNSDDQLLLNLFNEVDRELYRKSRNPMKKNQYWFEDTNTTYAISGGYIRDSVRNPIFKLIIIDL